MTRRTARGVNSFTLPGSRFNVPSSKFRDNTLARGRPLDLER